MVNESDKTKISLWLDYRSDLFFLLFQLRPLLFLRSLFQAPAAGVWVEQGTDIYHPIPSYDLLPRLSLDHRLADR